MKMPDNTKTASVLDIAKVSLSYHFTFNVARVTSCPKNGHIFTFYPRYFYNFDSTFFFIIDFYRYFNNDIILIQS